MRNLQATILVLATAGLGSCVGDPPADTAAKGDPGALIAVNMDSTVGVLLDEIPAPMRDRVANNLIGKPLEFWKQRAEDQIELTTYRLVFRKFFYEKGKPRDSLAISSTKSLWNVALRGAPRRTMVKGHDLVVIDYTFATTILTDAESPGISEPALKGIKGRWSEPFIFPIDPKLVFQRTRFACMDEEDFPPNSVDSEETSSFYDQECDVEAMLSDTACHQTELPAVSCVDALDAKIGKVTTEMRFERLKWNTELANKVRLGPITNPKGPDMQVVGEEFRENRLVYRYIQPDSCTLVEQCVGGPGWRRLLQFSTSDQNTGTKDVHIGAVDYYQDGVPRPLIDHGVYELSACHQHYHFMHYGTFSYGQDAATTSKRGFCLQATIRYLNNEYSKLTNPYAGCDFQGVGSGWADQYRAGLECQWIDVTAIDTTKKAVTKALTFSSNPDGFLCEGEPKLDANGDQIFEPTNFTTLDGRPVDRPACDLFPGWDANNLDSYDVTLTTDGEGYVTAACKSGQIGPLRNCGFKKRAENLGCTAGGSVKLRCTTSATAAQVARFCDYSKALRTGIPCTYQEALATAVIEPSGSDVTFTCPAARDAVETGGRFSLYAAPVYPGDAAAAIHCVAR
ncbi:MAG: hypothetical protein EXR72_10795 [Myxococcales bacterium]|nr:hypothetical protein [Myxococcales bacterium]